MSLTAGNHRVAVLEWRHPVLRVDSTGADAWFVDGILNLRLPKSEAARPHKIRVERKPQTVTSEHYPAIEGGVQKEVVPVR